MEVLAEKIAELLGITIESAVELYPYLRDQYVLYEVLESSKSLFMILLFLSVISTVLMVIFLFMEEVDFSEPDAEERMFIKITKNCAIVAITFLVIVMGVNIAQAVIAPDIMMIQELLGN